MLSDSDNTIQFQTVYEVISLCTNKNTEMTPDDECAKPKSIADGAVKVRIFSIPEININAEFYHYMIQFDKIDVIEPPATKRMNKVAIQNFKTSNLQCDYPCHNQASKRHVKLVTETSMHVRRLKRLGGMVRQKVTSQKLMPFINTTKQSYC